MRLPWTKREPEGMKVYVLNETYGTDFSEPLGIYTTREAAASEGESLKLGHGGYYIVEDWITDFRPYIHYYYVRTTRGGWSCHICGQQAESKIAIQHVEGCVLGTPEARALL